MCALPRTSRRPTLGQALIGLLIVMNIVLVVFLLRGSRGQSGSAPAAAPDGDRGGAPARAPGVRAARRAGQAEEGTRRPSSADDRDLADERELDPLTPPEDPEDAYDRLIDMARPTRAEEQVMRTAFEKHYPRAEAAYRAHDLEGAKTAWRAYCDELAQSLDERRLKRMGCIEAPPPPVRQPRPAPAAPPAAPTP